MSDDPIHKSKGQQISWCIYIYIDEHLSWSNHIDHLAKEISSGLAGLKQIRLFVPPETLVVIYKSLILPLVDYCDVVWAGVNKGLSVRLGRLQNRAARIITQSDRETRSADILKLLKWGTFEDRRQHHYCSYDV